MAIEYPTHFFVKWTPVTLITITSVVLKTKLVSSIAVCKIAESFCHFHRVFCIKVHNIAVFHRTQRSEQWEATRSSRHHKLLHFQPWIGSARSPPSPRNRRKNRPIHSKMSRKLHRITFSIHRQLSQTITNLFVSEKTGEKRWYLHVIALQPAMLTCVRPPSLMANNLFTDLYWITLMIHGLSSPQVYKS